MIKVDETGEAKVEVENPQLVEGSRIHIKGVLREVQQGAEEALDRQVGVGPADLPPEEVGLVTRVAVDVQLPGETLRRVEDLLVIKAKAKVPEN